VVVHQSHFNSCRMSAHLNCISCEKPYKKIEIIHILEKNVVYLYKMFMINCEEFILEWLGNGPSNGILY
jgi:hypothetical protein